MDDPFDVQSVQTESVFMQKLAKLIREHRDIMDIPTMAGDLERCLTALDEGMLDSEWGPPPAPRGEAEVDISTPILSTGREPWKPIKLDNSRPVTEALEDRDHRIAQLEATVKDLMAKMNK